MQAAISYRYNPANCAISYAESCFKKLSNFCSNGPNETVVGFLGVQQNGLKKCGHGIKKARKG